jgi:hypothetical protein
VEGRLSIAVLAKLLPLKDAPNIQVGGAIARRKRPTGPEQPGGQRFLCLFCKKGTVKLTGFGRPFRFLLVPRRRKSLQPMN